MESCSIGIHCNQQMDCHKLCYTKSSGLKNLCELSPNDYELLLRRSGYSGQLSTATVCKHHEQVFLKQYSFLQKSCCDPFHLHPDTVRKKSLRAVDLQTADAINQLSGSYIRPGQKLCPNCRKCSVVSEGSASQVESEEEMHLCDLEVRATRSDAWKNTSKN